MSQMTPQPHPRLKFFAERAITCGDLRLRRRFFYSRNVRSMCNMAKFKVLMGTLIFQIGMKIRFCAPLWCSPIRVGSCRSLGPGVASLHLRALGPSPPRVAVVTCLRKSREKIEWVQMVDQEAICTVGCVKYKRFDEDRGSKVESNHSDPSYHTTSLSMLCFYKSRFQLLSWHGHNWRNQGLGFDRISWGILCLISYRCAQSGLHRTKMLLRCKSTHVIKLKNNGKMAQLAPEL